MAISLSNHEDRIKALENKSSSWVIIAEYNDVTGDTIHLRQSYYNFNLIIIEWYYYGFMQHLTNIFDFSVGYLFNLYDPIDSSTIFKIETVSTTTWKLHMSGTGMRFNRIRGLKLYYNFSYNIYRLANSISFHFFKCLINSFKGGVKEIWQLV